MTNLTDNPYVGPRTFLEKEKDWFFGRENEARDLLSLVLSDRVVLFYAASGAGKSSLINTRLRPRLEQKGFEVFPTGRVKGELPEDITEVDNIFMFNLILRLNQGEHEPASVSFITLSEYLEWFHDSTSTDNDKPRSHVLIIDQFEEIITTNIEQWEKRENFFEQLREAINNDPLLWTVLALREDYIAPLDPYAPLLPGKLRTRFYMQPLRQKAALEAIECPAEKQGRRFAPGVAQALVDDLRTIRPPSRKKEDYLGEFIEPMHLQVVCHRLWEQLVHFFHDGHGMPRSGRL